MVVLTVPFVVAAVLGLIDLTALTDFLFSPTGIIMLIVTKGFPILS